MKMRVRYRLSGGLAYVDADVVAIRSTGGFDVAAHSRHQRAHRGLLGGRERQEVRLVPPWNNEAVPRSQGKGVRERGGEVILGDEVPLRQVVAEEAGHDGDLSTRWRLVQSSVGECGTYIKLTTVPTPGIRVVGLRSGLPRRVKWAQHVGRRGSRQLLMPHLIAVAPKAAVARRILSAFAVGDTF